MSNLPDFKRMTRARLKAYHRAIEKELAEREKREEKRKEKALERIRQIAAKEGLTLAEVARAGRGRSAARRRTTGKVPPKYRNPKDRSQTWTGRGRKPRWVQEHLDRGGTLEQLAIKR